MTDSLDLDVPTPDEAVTAAPASSELALTPPAPVAVVPLEQATARVPLTDQRTTEIEARAAAFVTGFVDLDPKDPEFARKVDDVAKLGNDKIMAASQASNRMLDRPTAALAGARGKGGDLQVQVADGLAKLRFQVEDLDPSKVGAGSILGDMFGMKNKWRNYFARYQSAQTHLNKILQSLESGADRLRKDNAAIDGEKVRLWELMRSLREYAELTAALDTQMVARIDTIRETDPERAKALTSEVLFPVRQKHQDLLTQLAVSAQGYLVLDMLRKNNVELVKGVERSCTTTVSSLRTAVLASQALTGQKMVLDQIDALNTTTESMILATSVMLKDQSAEIHQRAASSTISMETLQVSFQNIYDTIDAVDTFKAQAVESMQSTVDALSGQLAKAGQYLERTRTADASKQIGA